MSEALIRFFGMAVLMAIVDRRLPFVVWLSNVTEGRRVDYSRYGLLRFPRSLIILLICITMLSDQISPVLVGLQISVLVVLVLLYLGFAYRDIRGSLTPY